LAIHWVRYGPYHIARFVAAQDYLSKRDINLVGIQIAQSDRIYAWREYQNLAELGIHTIFPDRLYEDLGYADLAKGLPSHVKDLSPGAMAICGYKTKDAFLLQLICRLNNIPMVLMSETKGDDFQRNKAVEYIKRYLIRSYSSALCGGTPQKKYLIDLGMPAERIFLGYDAIDNEYFSIQADLARGASDQYSHLPGLDTASPFFLASSRFIPRKNLDGLVRAYRLYRTKAGSVSNQAIWRLVILGDGEERATLEGVIREEDVQDVTLAGFRQIDETPIYYGLAKAFIHPALEDQWGLVVNEAMSAGLPILVSKKCGCASDLVEHGSNGFVFNPEDAAQLADCMLQISSDPDRLEQMGRASKEKISHWGLDKFAEGLYGAAIAAWKN
jgi:1,2-diacylglycerol 3-alpha-glucosyltransferase